MSELWKQQYKLLWALSVVSKIDLANPAPVADKLLIFLAFPFF